MKNYCSKVSQSRGAQLLRNTQLQFQNSANPESDKTKVKKEFQENSSKIHLKVSKNHENSHFIFLCIAC